MGREIVGLKIGASRIAAARVSLNGSARLLQIASMPLPPGLVSGGEVRDVDALANVLKSFFDQHKLPRRAVRVGVANNRVGVRTIELAGIDDPKQLGNAVRFRAQEALPIPLTEAVMDYQVLSQSVDPEGQLVRRVLFVVAYRDLIDNFARACKQAGLRLVGIDLEGFALLRALAPFAEVSSPDGERSALIAISIGAERSTLAVTDGLSCEFTRVLDWGGSALTTAIARDLNIDLTEAEQIKRAISLDGEPPDGVDESQAVKAREAILLNLQSFARELVSSLQFYQNQPGSLGIREIVLAGGTAKLDGFAEALQRMVAVSVRVGDPLVNIDHGRKTRNGDVDPSLAIADRPRNGELMDWKKEIRLSDLLRRGDSSGQEGTADWQAETARQTGSDTDNVWKKEIRLSSVFRRQKKSKQPALPPYGASTASAPADAPRPRPESESVWKKEIKLSGLFRRRKVTASHRGPLALPPAGQTIPEAPTASEPPGRDERQFATPGSSEVGGAVAATVGSAAADERSGSEPAAFESKSSRPGDAGPEQREDREQVKGARRGPGRKPRSGDDLPRIPLMHSLNLLPRDAQLATRSSRPWLLQAVAIGASVVVLVGVGFLYLSAKNDVADNEQALETKQAELVALQAELAPSATDDTALAGEALSRATALSSALSTRFNWDRLLRQLSLTLPDDVWFDSFQSTNPAAEGVGSAGAAPAGTAATAAQVPNTPTSLTITGYGRSQSDIAYLLARLETVPAFSAVQLQSSSRVKIGDVWVIQFSVLGALK